MRESNRTAVSEPASSFRRKYRAEKLKKKKSSPVINLLKTMAVFAFVIWCVFSYVITQSEIVGKKSELDALKERAAVLERENEEYSGILTEEDERAFMERIAVETLGYAYPNERRFIDTTRN